MPVVVTSLYHSSLNYLAGLTHSFLTESPASYLTEKIVIISHKLHPVYYLHVSQFSLLAFCPWGGLDFLLKINPLAIFLISSSAPFLSFSFHVFPQSMFIACLAVLGYAKPEDAVEQDGRIPSPHGFSILLCGLQSLFNFHLLFYLQYVLSVTLLFQLTDLFSSSSYLKYICLFCWPWRHVSPSLTSPVLESAAVSVSIFTTIFHSSMHGNFTFVLCTSETSFIHSLWHGLPSLNVMNYRREYNSFSWPYLWYFCLYLHSYCWTPEDSYFGSLFSFYLFFRNILPTPMVSIPVYMLITPKF